MITAPLTLLAQLKAFYVTLAEMHHYSPGYTDIQMGINACIKQLEEDHGWDLDRIDQELGL